MKNKPLKVQPARKVYQPKYPSYLDKNPLLHPETRPYPFTHKFINWVSTGGLAGAMLFCGSDLSAQTKTDSLYNPFRMKNARVPYVPASFGTGMAERLTSEEAVMAIQRAFSESGIDLQKDTFLKEVGFVVDGYSAEDNIGFAYISTKMDETFVNDHYRLLRRLGAGDFSLEGGIKEYEYLRNMRFEWFLTDKDNYFKNSALSKPKEFKKQYAEHLYKLNSVEESEALFNDNYLKEQLGKNRQFMSRDTGFISETAQHIDKRLEDSVEKAVLISYALGLSRFKNEKGDFFNNVVKAIEKIKKQKSNKKFTVQFVSIIEFLNHHNYLLYQDQNYQTLKLDIMNNTSPRKWIKNIAQLDRYHDRKLASMDEVREIENRAESGTQFIAPVFGSDPMMVVPDMYYYPPPDSLAEEQKLLHKEFNDRNGMTDEVQAQKQKEWKEVFKNHQYNYSPAEGYLKEKHDSVQKIIIDEHLKIIAKYKAMELLSEEEKKEYKAKFRDMEKRIWNWKNENRDVIRQETLRKLEEQVKIYIKWAK